MASLQENVERLLRQVPTRRVAPLAVGFAIFLLLVTLWRSSSPRTHVYEPIQPEIEDSILRPHAKEDGIDISYQLGDKVTDPVYVPSVTSVQQQTFWHTDWFHVPEHRGDVNHCDNVTSDQVHDLARSIPRPIHLLTPRAWHFHDGVLVTDKSTGFPAGTGFCTVIIAPQAPARRNLRFEQKPMEGLGPDAIQAEISSSDVRFIFTEHPLYWGTFGVKDGFFSKNMVDLSVYASSYELNQPGDYQLHGVVEWHDYDWLMEEPLDMHKAFHRYRPSERNIVPSSPAVSITGKPLSRPTAQCFFNGNNDVRGRWYRAGAFGAHGEQTSLNVKARVEFADKIPTIDDWGWTFAPDRCSLTFFTFTDHKKCFAGKNIQYLGDSNGRRVIKSLIGGGEKWCPGFNFNERIAQCEDRKEEYLEDFDGKEVNLTLIHDQALDKQTPTIFGSNSSVFLDFVGGINRWAVFNGWELYLNGRRNTTDLERASEPLSIVAQRQHDFQPADVVYISLITWDVSHMITPSETLALLPDFRTKLLESFHEKARIVMRLTHSPSWGNWNNRSRFSLPRYQMWNTMWREFWDEDVQSGRVMLQDASVLQGRKDAEQALKCPQTHLRCSHARIEEQIWMNTVCEKHPWNGETVMRRWR